jgi:hypothetical protein
MDYSDKERKLFNKILSKKQQAELEALKRGETSELSASTRTVFENIQKDIIKRRVIKAGDAFNVGLLDDKYKLPYLESKYPELQFAQKDNKIQMSRDGGRTFTDVAVDPKFKVSKAAGFISPFILGAGTGIVAGTVTANPAIGLAAGGGAAGTVQALREKAEAEIKPEILEAYNMKPQTLLQRYGDVAAETAVDMAGGAVVGKAIDYGGALMRQPAVKQAVLGPITTVARRVGSISDELMTPRINAARQMLGERLVKNANKRGSAYAGGNLQSYLQRIVESEKGTINSLWTKAKDESAAALNEFNKLVEVTADQIKATSGTKIPIDQLRKQVANEVKGQTNYLIDFSPEYRSLMTSLREASGKSGPEVFTNIKAGINNALFTSREAGATMKALRNAGLGQKSVKTVTPNDLITLRDYIGTQIGKATDAKDANLKRVLTQFKDNIDVRLGSTDIPGAETVRTALATEAKSYEAFPRELRQKLLQKPSKGRVQDISPEKAFEATMGLNVDEKKLIGNLIQRDKNFTREFADDLQARSIRAGGLETQQKLDITGKSAKEARFTTKAGLRQAIEEGYVPNRQSVKDLEKTVQSANPAETFSALPSKAAWNYLTTGAGKDAPVLIGQEQFERISRPVQRYMGTMVEQNPSATITKNSNKTIYESTKDLIIGLGGGAYTLAANSIEPLIRPAARGIADITSASQFTNPTLNQAANAARSAVVGFNAPSDELKPKEKKLRIELANLLGVF